MDAEFAGEVPPPTTTEPLCLKCHQYEGTLYSRSQLVCRNCFSKFISAKCVKQVGIIGKDIRNPGSGSGAESQKKKYVLGLSLGVSSSALVHLLNENVEYQLAKGRTAPFELIVVHIDPSCLYCSSDNDRGGELVEATLDRYRKRYSRFDFRLVPVSDVLNLGTVDWSTLPCSTDEAAEKGQKKPDTKQQLRELFQRLPSSTSRADILRLFTRHLLISEARQNECHALLLGHTTTALAELTLSETAKGRGFSLPWQVNDGPVAVVGYQKRDKPATTTVQIYHPLRDLLRKELVVYASELTTPSLVADLAISIPNHAASSSQQPAPVVSHKDLSIEEVMFRYFAEVEENYPSVVANVARTTGKLVRILDRHGGEEEGVVGGGNGSSEKRERCGLCSLPLDEQGDERWRGELGDDEVHQKGGGKGRICYGCERSLRG
ncbi:Protein of unknown function (DUF2392) domain containing protein [Naviculisporaceae sp. PSN 640]